MRTDEWVRKKKLWAIEHMGGVCLDCQFDFDGRPECAQFDHREGRTIPHGVSITRMRKDRMLKELAQCDLVCANCHMIRTKSRQQTLLARPEKEAVLSAHKPWKTHCFRGHLLDEENSRPYTASTGATTVICRRCERTQHKIAYQVKLRKEEQEVA